MSYHKIAVLIADVSEEPFMEIKAKMRELMEGDFQSNGVDFYYIKGKDLSVLRRTKYNLIERIRYTNFWLLQYSHDYLTMIHYKFFRARTQINGQDIHVDIPEGLSHLTIKMIAGFEVLEELGYDFVYRTTLSTVINLDLLKNYTNSLGLLKEVYAGYLVDFNIHPFISGSSTLLNAKAIRTIGKNRRKLNFARLDDVAIGRLFETLVKPVSIPQLNLETPEDVQKISEQELKQVLSYRCKTTTIPRTDWQIAHLVMSKLRDQRCSKSDAE